MSISCPSCGVAVVPGYVRCPKCQKPLPQTRRPAVDAGGTALETRGGFPIVPVVVGVAVIGGLFVMFAMFGGDDKRDMKAADPAAPAPVVQLVQGAVAPTPPVTIAAPVTPTGPTPGEAAALLDREIKKQRLWGTVEVVGARVDVRSGGCSDPAMGPLLDAQTPTLKDVGLTKLRCLAQSGRVVFERDL